METEVKVQKPIRLACLDAFRGLDILIMIFVNYIAGMKASPGWLQHVADGVDAYTITYLLTRGNRTSLMGAMGFMIALYIGVRHGALDFLGPAVHNFIRIDSNFGSHAAIVTAGMLAGSLFIPGGGIHEHKPRMRFMFFLGAGTVLAGYILRPLHGINKPQATDS